LPYLLSCAFFLEPRADPFRRFSFRLLVDPSTIAKIDDTVAPSTPPITEPISIPWEYVPTPTDSLPTEEKEAKEMETSEAQSVETAGEIADDLGLEKSEMSAEAKEDLEGKSGNRSLPFQSCLLRRQRKLILRSLHLTADSTVQSSTSEPSSAKAVDAFSIAQADDTVAATTPPITDPISIPWEHVLTPTDSLPIEEKEAKEKETSDAQSVETAPEIADDLDLERKDLSEEATASAPAVVESGTSNPANAERFFRPTRLTLWLP
jgi:LPS O-antigen subunit length determinant protein (WzzB/FepE family)